MTEGELPIPTRRYWSGASSDEKMNALALLEQRIQALRATTPSFAQSLAALEQAAGEIKRLQEAVTAVRRLAQNIEDEDLRIQIMSACSDG
jgi:methylthioribose-1-phosphate isomerase